MAVDRAHLARVQAVLDVLTDCYDERGPAHASALAVIACEDAIFAYTLGAKLGLSPRQVADQSRVTMAQIQVEARLASLPGSPYE